MYIWKPKLVDALLSLNRLGPAGIGSAAWKIETQRSAYAETGERRERTNNGEMDARAAVWSGSGRSGSKIWIGSREGSKRTGAQGPFFSRSSQPESDNRQASQLTIGRNGSLGHSPTPTIASIQVPAELRHQGAFTQVPTVEGGRAPVGKHRVLDISRYG